jgi:hypothetical protein
VTLEVPQWVRLACQRWGRQKRRIWSGRGEWYVDRLGRKTCHVDGYAESFLARVQDEKVGAGSSSEVHQHWVEVYFGDALEVQRNLAGMPEECFAALHLAFVFDPEFALTARRKAELLELPLRTYAEAVIRGEMWVWARLEAKTPCVPDFALPHVLEPQEKAGLPICHKAHTLPRNSARVAELSLAALRRPTLARRR